MEMKSMRKRSLDVVQDALNGRQVLFAQVVHVKTHLLNNIGNVRARECEVLESPGETPILSRVGHRRSAEAESLGNVSTGVVADLQAVMPALSRISTAYLQEVHAGGVAGDRDAEEVVEAAHVRHGELGAEGGGDPVEKPGRGGGVDNVVDVRQEKVVPSAH
jgi:hypothetical protein